MVKIMKKALRNKPQCEFEVGIREDKKQIYYCVLDKGHKGIHRITLGEELYLIHRLHDAKLWLEMVGKHKELKRRIQKATRCFDNLD